MQQKKGRKKKWLIIAAVFVLIVAGIIKYLAGISPKIDGPFVRVHKYEKQDLSEKINVTGTVESRKVMAVSTDLTCKVKELKVSLGDHVNEGDVVCVFDDTQLREQIAELEAQASEKEKLEAKQSEIAKRALTQAQDSRTREVNRAESAVNQLQNDYNTAVNIYHAWENSGTEQEAEAYKEMKALENSLAEAKNQLEAVKRSSDEAVQAAQDNLDIGAISDGGSSELTKSLSDLYRQLEEVNVKAGQSGIITRLNIAEGSIASGILMQIEDNTNLQLKVSIKEKDILKLKEGMQAAITADALKEQEYKGEVIRVINFAASGDHAMEISGTGMGGYSADIAVNGESQLLLGMSAKASIMISDNGEALSVAYDSIVTEGENGGQSYVYKAVPKEGKKCIVEKVPVTVGKNNDYYTQVTSERLTEGDMIVSYPEMVKEGDEIEIMIPSE